MRFSSTIVLALCCMAVAGFSGCSSGAATTLTGPSAQSPYGSTARTDVTDARRARRRLAVTNFYNTGYFAGTLVV